MKVHYINILLFALPLNILVNTHKKPHTTPRHTKSNRSLCELYAPVNYDNEPQMKEVMENFNKQTQERFHEYDERMKTTRQKCKEQCDKDIQKIILKDKLEKELMDKFVTLHTDIQNDAIPSCVCENSLADKVEKGCLQCGYGLGTVAPTVGLIGTVAVHVWKPGALKVAIAAAKQGAAANILATAKAAGIKAGDAAGMKVISFGLEQLGIKQFCRQIFESFVTTKRYTDVTTITEAIVNRHQAMCALTTSSGGNPECAAFGLKLGTHLSIDNPGGPPASFQVPKVLGEALKKATQAADAAAKDEVVKVTAAENAAIEAAQEEVMEAASTQLYGAIGYSILAIIIIILIMVIIYKILRYRRKKKMKKKLQYIKLLEE